VIKVFKCIPTCRIRAHRKHGQYAHREDGRLDNVT